MKTAAVFLIFMFALAACTGDRNTWSREKIKSEVLALERQANDQWSAGHPRGFSKNFAADITWFDDIAAQSRIEGIKKVNNYFATLEGKVPPHQYKLVSPRVQIYGDVAILTYQYHGSFPDEKTAPPWKTTSVYHLKNNKWQVVHAHWSLIQK